MFQCAVMLMVILIFLGFVDFVSATVYGEANIILQILSIMFLVLTMSKITVLGLASLVVNWTLCICFDRIVSVFTDYSEDLVFKVRLMLYCNVGKDCKEWNPSEFPWKYCETVEVAANDRYFDLKTWWLFFFY